MKDNEEMEKIKEYSQKNIRIVYNSLCVCVCMCMCLCRLYLHIIVCGRLSDI